MKKNWLLEGRKYLADFLTAIRFICAILIFVGLREYWAVEVVLILFGVGELTDAFDGFCSRKWSFPKGAEPKYRKYAAKYDMLIDALLWFNMVVFFTMRVNFGLGFLIGAATIIGAYVVELRVYGRLFGHPDDCEKWSICATNFVLAKKIILARRAFYLLTVIVMIVATLFATEWGLWVKILLVVLGAGVGAFLWFFLETRRKNISREVKLEKKLLRKVREKLK